MPLTCTYKIDCSKQICCQLSASSLEREQGKNFNKLWKLTLLLQCPAVFQQEEGKMNTLSKSEQEKKRCLGLV